MAIDVKEPELREVVSRPGTPTWEIARLYPTQGHWSEAEYLALDTNQLIEFTNGYLEFLPMPSLYHQLIAKFLFVRLNELVTQQGAGQVLFAPLRIRVAQDSIREPDIVFLRNDRVKRMPNYQTPPDGADLVMEVISPGEKSRARDLIQKRKEYAAAGIAEYWIVDPEAKTITVLYLKDECDEYTRYGEFADGQSATSHLFPEFHIPVRECFAVGEPPQPKSAS